VRGPPGRAGTGPVHTARQAAASSSATTTTSSQWQCRRVRPRRDDTSLDSDRDFGWHLGPLALSLSLAEVALIGT
jgi:hypothetical protein